MSVVQVVQVPQVQIIEEIVEVRVILSAQGAQPSPKVWELLLLVVCLFAETVDRVEGWSPLPAESVPLVRVTTPVVDVPPVVVEEVQFALVIHYVAPVPPVAHATLAAVDEDFAPVLAVCCAGEQAPVVDYIAPVPSVRAEHAHVDVCIAPALAVAYTAQPPVDECNASDPAVSYAPPSRVIEHEAPISANDYHASMLDIIETFHQPVGQIPDVPTLASSSSACAAPAPGDRLQLRTSGSQSCR